MLANRYFFSRGVKASDDYHQFWIRYKPERVSRKRARGLFSNRFKLYSTCFLAFTFAAVFFGSFSLFALLVTFLIAAALATQLLHMLAPTHIFLSEDGLQMHWLRSFCNIAGPMIGWDRLSHVSIARLKVPFSSEERALEFNVLATGLPLKERIIYAFLAPNMTSGWLKGERAAIRVRLNGIASSDDRKRLQMSLKKFLPSYRIDASVTDELNLAIRVESYTDLWLDALSSSKRIRDQSLEPGAHILGGKYVIVTQLGGGGQAVVYDAVERTSVGNGSVSEVQVVLKEFVLPSQAGANVRKRVLGNIQREAEILKRLQFHNIVRFIDFFVDDQRAYLVLEHIDGMTVKSYIEEKGALPESEVIDLGIKMCRILKNLHSCMPPVIHRDFTPDNLMLDSNNDLKLIDFNVAEHLEASDTNSVVGKHAFIPPEQFRGKATEQSDIYALGGTLNFLLTAQEPEPITMSEPKSVRVELSDAINEVVMRATAQEASERFSSWSQVELALEKIAHQASGWS